MASAVLWLSRSAYVSFHILLAVLFVKTNTEFCGSVFESHEGHTLVGHTMSTVVVSDIFECQLKCLALDIRCKSFNVHHGEDHTKRICELNNKTRETKPSDFKKKKGSIYYGSVKVSCLDRSHEKTKKTNSGHCHPGYGGKRCQTRYKNCAELHKDGQQTSGIYTIKPDSCDAFDVYCDQTTAGGGWTVFQKRLDGSFDFYRGWDDYKRGFGSLNGEFWLGLDKIHRLTKERSKIRVDLEDFSENTAYAEYDLFGVGNEADKYQLTIGSYSGAAGDSLSYHNGMAFTTRDQDNDKRSGLNCASQFKGAWWYKNCHNSNLNGLYLKGAHSSYADGVIWYHWKGHHYSVKTSEMKIKPVDG